MKRLIFAVAMLMFSIAASAQRIMIPTTPVTDSIKTRRLKDNKIQEVNGIRMGTANDIVENIAHSPRFTILIKAVRAAGLVQTLKSKGPITFFAPTDAAFKKLPKGKLDTLMKRNHRLQLTDLLTCHAVAGRLTAKDLTKQISAGNGKASLTTLGGCKLTASLDTDNNIILTDDSGHQCMIETSDIEQVNGLIHVINGVLVPKPKVI